MPSKSELRQKWDNAGENVVVLHMFVRSKNRPNGSPFVMKFETYLRMADIKHEVDVEQPFSSKGKSPWMTFNKEEMADSQLCMEHLAEKLDKDLSKDLTKEQKAVARALRIMAEEHLYFVLLHYEFGINKGKIFKENNGPLPGPGFLNGFVLSQIVRTMTNQTKAQGIGRHSKEEIIRLGVQDLNALSDYLGDKPFFMGNNPCELDCVVFGFTSMILFAGAADEENPFVKAIESDMGNLKEHCLRIKEKYWSDWDDCLYKPPVKAEKTKKESKVEKSGKEEEAIKDEKANTEEAKPKEEAETAS